MAGIFSFSAPFVLAAFALDLVLGDPPHWPHPVRWIGRLIQTTEGVFYKGGDTPTGQRLRGVLFWIVNVCAVSGCVAVLLAAANWIHGGFAALCSLWIAYTALATRSLYDESKAVATALESGRIDEARRLLSRIVSRQTEHLDAEGIWKALLETVSENLSDGVMAPLFYLALGGPLGVMVYKAVNTMDSMVGYKNDRYIHFGWWAARMDDLVNWIPARLTALALVAAGAAWGLNWRRGWAVMRRDARKHKSPNAGFPEAAAAGLLGVQLGGPGVYFGRVVVKPALGDPLRPVDGESFRIMVRLLFTTSALGALSAALVRALWGG
ncbi:MAG: adenosylcobinamide-phosphate synthase CbiB [Desulfosoma sp.]